MFKRSVLGMVIVLVGVLAVSAPASVIGMNINTTLENCLDPSTVGTNLSAGVVSASNWNDLSAASDTWVSLHNDSGAATGAEFKAYYTQYYQCSPNFVNAGDNRLMSGHIYNNAGTDTVVEFRNLPYAQYDVYVYYNSGGITNNYQTFTIDGTAFSAVGSELTATPDTAFVLSTGTNDANYVKFSGVTLPSFTLRASAAAGYSYLNGLQIVQVPEPATIALLTLGGLLLRRRR